MLFVARRHGKVIRLALPIMLGMLSQSMLNLIDAALVGHLGEVALAGVGVGGYAMFMLSAVVFGLSSSVQSQTAHRVGAAHTEIAHPLRSGLVIGLAVALPLTLWAWWQVTDGHCANTLFSWLLEWSSTDASLLTNYCGGSFAQRGGQRRFDLWPGRPACNGV